VQELGLINQYKSDEEFRLFSGTCMLDRLAFLPVCDVAAGLDHLRSIMPPAAGPLTSRLFRFDVRQRCVQAGASGQYHCRASSTATSFSTDYVERP